MRVGHSLKWSSVLEIAVFDIDDVTLSQKKMTRVLELRYDHQEVVRKY